MPLPEAYDQPVTATVVEGSVVIVGPGAISGAFTPEAALAGWEAVKAAAEEAIRGRAGRPAEPEDG